MSIINNIFTIFLVSSNLINRIESTRPIPDTSKAKEIPTKITNGNFQEIACPEITQTSASGIIPMKKFSNPAMEVTIGKI
jgi:hypothetical protein